MERFNASWPDMAVRKTTPLRLPKSQTRQFNQNSPGFRTASRCPTAPGGDGPCLALSVCRYG